MLVFLDETFRTHPRTGVKFGALMGVAIPEDVFARFQRDFYEICRPYYGTVLDEAHDIHGKDLLSSTTFRVRREARASAHYSLAEDVLRYARHVGIRVFGVVCFRSDLHTFVCEDDGRLELPFRYLFERIDHYMRDKFPSRFAKLIFDDRGHSTNQRNGRAAANFFMRSHLGISYDTIIKTPFFAVSKAHNRGLQLADIVTTVVGIKFQGGPTKGDASDIEALWRVVHQMLYYATVGEIRQSSLKVIRNENEKEARRPEGPSPGEEPGTEPPPQASGLS